MSHRKRVAIPLFLWGSGVVGIRGVSEVNPETGSSIGVLRVADKEEHPVRWPKEKGW